MRYEHALFGLPMAAARAVFVVARVCAYSWEHGPCQVDLTIEWEIIDLGNGKFSSRTRLPMITVVSFIFFVSLQG
jgi:hypothetical protein